MPMITDDEYADYIDELIKLGEAIVSAWTDMAKRLRAEAESLKKQLSMTGEALIEFKLRFSMWQAAYVQMKTALEKVPEEQAEKCRAAVRAVVEGWNE